MKKLILASQSPRRRGILETAQIPFEVEVSHVSEETDQTKPAKIVEELAGRLKEMNKKVKVTYF